MELSSIVVDFIAVAYSKLLVFLLNKSEFNQLLVTLALAKIKEVGEMSEKFKSEKIYEIGRFVLALENVGNVLCLSTVSMFLAISFYQFFDKPLLSKLINSITLLLGDKLHHKHAASLAYSAIRKYHLNSDERKGILTV